MKRLAPAFFCVSAVFLCAAETPTTLFEWVSRSGSAMQRLTLHADHTLILKSDSKDSKDFKKRILSSEEYDYYIAYFREAQNQERESHFESGLTGDFTYLSTVTFHVPGKPDWKFSFDSFSTFTPEGWRVKAALEGLRDSFEKVLPSPDDFLPARMPVGTILTRLDGARFRVVRYDTVKGMVELEGLDQPYSLFSKAADLRFTFHAP